MFEAARCNVLVRVTLRALPLSHCLADTALSQRWVRERKRKRKRAGERETYIDDMGVTESWRERETDTEG